MHRENDNERRTKLPLAALGIVHGDIGTSPLYTIKEVFGGRHHPVSDHLTDIITFDID